MLCGELNGTPKGRTLFPGMSLFIGGIAVYFILLALTGILMKRMVTTELFLIVAWAVLELSVINSLYSRETAGRTGQHRILRDRLRGGRGGSVLLPAVLRAGCAEGLDRRDDSADPGRGGDGGGDGFHGGSRKCRVGESARSDEAAAVKEDTMTVKERTAG
jgi:hypothetical protein